MIIIYDNTQDSSTSCASKEVGIRSFANEIGTPDPNWSPR